MARVALKDTLRTASDMAVGVFGSVHKRGLPKTVRLLYHEFLYDAKHGTDTGGFIPVAQLRDMETAASPEAEAYQAISPVLFRELFSRLRWPMQESTMVDFGCGKGRGLLLAAEFGVKRAIGVEFSGGLCAIAAQNLIRHRAVENSRTELRVVHADATRFRIPSDANLFFFFNPFGGSTLARVLDRIDASLRRYPRPALLMYCNPQPLDILIGRGYPLAERFIEGDARTGDYIVLMPGQDGVRGLRSVPA